MSSIEAERRFSMRDDNLIIRRLLVCLSLLAFVSGAQGLPLQKSASVQPKTIINDQQAKQMLIGPHRLSLQWISWDYFGKINVTESNGVLMIKGEQKGRGTGDYLTVDGVITSVDAKEFGFKGIIITKVSYNNNGEPCKREGEMTFRITNNRKYWRLKEMDSPCEEIVDYVDIFFR
jgi:hypothetical protein